MSMAEAVAWAEQGKFQNTHASEAGVALFNVVVVAAL